MDEKMLKVLEDIRDGQKEAIAFQKEAFEKTEACQDVIMENQKKVMAYNERMMKWGGKQRKIFVVLGILWLLSMIYIIFF